MAERKRASNRESNQQRHGQATHIHFEVTNSKYVFTTIFHVKCDTPNFTDHANVSFVVKMWIKSVIFALKWSGLFSVFINTDLFDSLMKIVLRFRLFFVALALCSCLWSELVYALVIHTTNYAQSHVNSWTHSWFHILLDFPFFFFVFIHISFLRLFHSHCAHTHTNSNDPEILKATKYPLMTLPTQTFYA